MNDAQHADVDVPTDPRDGIKGRRGERPIDAAHSTLKPGALLPLCHRDFDIRQAPSVLRHRAFPEAA